MNETDPLHENRKNVNKQTQTARGRKSSRISARRIFARLILIFCFRVILLLVLAFLFTLFLFLFNIFTLKQGYKSLWTLLHSPNLT